MSGKSVPAKACVWVDVSDQGYETLSQICWKLISLAIVASEQQQATLGKETKEQYEGST